MKTSHPVSCTDFHFNDTSPKQISIKLSTLFFYLHLPPTSASSHAALAIVGYQNSFSAAFCFVVNSNFTSAVMCSSL